jgi:hypothetical protein
MTDGERRLAQRLEDKLDDDYLIWYDVPVGSKQRRPDFIILHPLRGLFILEVKDWRLETIQQVNPNTITLMTPDGIKEAQNPLQQARDYVIEVVKLLGQDPLLVHLEGRHRGKLAFPYSHGVVLSNITRRQFKSQEGFNAVFQSNLIICKDEFYESVDPLALQERLWNLSPYSYGESLTSIQIDRIRWHIFPEVRINAEPLSLALAEPTVEVSTVLPEVLQVMDLEQEQLARSLGEGHRVVHGVAGSGKTLILVYRCLHLAQQQELPILVLCFNVALASKLRHLLHEKGAGQRVIVRHFHGWCRDLLQQHRISLPSWNQFSGEAYIQELVQQVIRSVDAGKIAAGCYGAVLIDEGHDFKPEWLKLAAQMVNPKTNALLLLYDDAQSIFQKEQRQKVSFKSLGIQAQGRTTVLKLNYRNTEDILRVAYEFARELLTPSDTEDEDVPVIVQPQSGGRRGPKPELVKLPSFTQEVDYLAQRVQQLHQQGNPWQEIAIVYRNKWMAERICRRFEQAQLPLEWINRDRDSRQFNPTAPSIKLVTMHSSKGLEFPVVLIPGLGYLPTGNQPEVDEARLVYVGMTRAVQQLVMTGHCSSRFVQRIEMLLCKA